MSAYFLVLPVMRITDTAPVTRKGCALFTDEPWSLDREREVATRRKVRVSSATGDREFAIRSLGSALNKTDGIRYLVLMVAKIGNAAIQEGIRHQEATFL
jgi:hypothetical protein